MNQERKIVDLYNKLDTLAEEILEKKMEDLGWEIDIDRPGEGEHDLRFRKMSNINMKGRGIGASRVVAMREAARTSLRADIGPGRCFQLGML